MTVILKEFELNRAKNQTKILAIVGPTATGKSDLSIKIAKQIDGEIVSADSMQVYKHMNIATAKLSENERCNIKHYLIDCVDLNSSFSVVDYVKFAKIALNEIVSKNKKPILVGGTGLYVDSFLKEINFNDGCNEQIRFKLISDLNTFGSEYLLQKLEKIDFEYAKKLHPNNHRRIIRALEIYYSTGITASENERKSKPKIKKLKYLKIGLNFLNRQALYDRINDRVDSMMKKGLLNEAKLIFNYCENVNSTAKQAIGYKEFKPYFEGTSSLKDCVDLLKQNTRRFAKRQLTWFKRDEGIKWFYLDEMGREEIFQQVLNLVQKFFTNEN